MVDWLAFGDSLLFVLYPLTYHIRVSTHISVLVGMYNL